MKKRGNYAKITFFHNPKKRKYTSPFFTSYINLPAVNLSIFYWIQSFGVIKKLQSIARFPLAIDYKKSILLILSLPQNIFNQRVSAIKTPQEEAAINTFEIPTKSIDLMISGSRLLQVTRIQIQAKKTTAFRLQNIDQWLEWKKTATEIVVRWYNTIKRREITRQIFLL